MANLSPTLFELAEPFAPDGLDAAKRSGGAWRTLPLAGTFQISYRDAAGRPSLRRLSARELRVGPGKMLLGGTDLATGAYRGFRVDRIHVIKDVESGEVTSRNVLDWLAKTATAQERVRRRAALAATKRVGRDASPVAVPRD